MILSRIFARRSNTTRRMPIAYQGLAEVQVRMKSLDGAEQTLRDLLKFLPDNANAKMRSVHC